jgi:hypothetical protein
MKVLRRVNHIAGYFNLRLVTAAQADQNYNGPTTAKAILQRISECDPTGDEHLMFLARCYSEQMFTLADETKVRDLLTKFETRKKSLSVKVTDHMLKLSELEDAVSFGGFPIKGELYIAGASFGTGKSIMKASQHG